MVQRTICLKSGIVRGREGENLKLGEVSLPDMFRLLDETSAYTWPFRKRIEASFKKINHGSQAGEQALKFSAAGTTHSPESGMRRRVVARSIASLNKFWEPMKLHHLVLFLAALSAGCTTSLTVKRFSENDPATAVGAPFPLMFTQYEVAVVRQVVSCGPRLKLKVTAEIKGNKAAPDPNQLFVLDTSSLSSPLKTSEVKTTYHPTGAVATLNAVAEDKSAAVVANVAQTLAKIVSIAALAGAAPGVAPEVCEAPTIAALAKSVELKKKVQVSGDLLDSLQSQLEDLMKKVNVTGGHPDAATKKAVSAAYDALAAASKDHGDLTEALEKAMKAITFKEIVRWPTNGDAAGGAVRMPLAVLKNWAKVDDQDSDNAAISLSLASAGGAARSDLAVPQKIDPALGIPYRAPALGTVRVCAGMSCTVANESLTDSTGAVQQLGYVYYLPCTSRAFTSVGCTLEFAEGGELKSAGSIQKAAAAEGLSGAVKEVVTQVGAAKEARSTADLKKLEAKAAALKAETDYQTALRASKPDPNAATQAEIDAQNLQADLATAKKKKIDADLALLEAESKVKP
jgi:hypothetical protein